MSRPRASVALLAAGIACAKRAAEPVTPGDGARLTAAERTALSNVRGEMLREVTLALTAREMRGRATGSEGGARAAQYIASRMSALGLEESAARSLLQPYVVYTTRVDTVASTLSAGGVVLHYGRDFRAADDGLPAPAAGTGPLVFVGYGVRDSSGHDDYPGIDVRGKIVAVLARRRNPIPADQPWVREIGTPATLHALLRAGALALVLVDRWPHALAATADADESSILTTTPPGSTPARAPVVVASEQAAGALFSAAGVSFASAVDGAARGTVVARPLAKSASITIGRVGDGSIAYNVSGVLPGSDPDLASEAIVFMAHFDAFGADARGAIRTGAADNALGAGVLLEVAATLSKGGRLRRSVIFLATSGEERGMLGATYFANHPPLPLANVIGVINFDGIGTELYGPVRRVVAYGADLSDLGHAVARASNALDMAPERDPFAAQQPFLHSDHIVFARRGIPSIMLLGLPADSVSVSVRRAGEWIATAYHQAGDTVRADWDWRGATDIARLALLIGRRVADGDARPAWIATSPYQRP